MIIFSTFFSGSVINDPSLLEIAEEWDLNVYSRAEELETGSDFTYKNAIVPAITQKLSKFSKRNSLVLDIGCGLGYLSNNIKVLGYKVEGIDISNESINYAKKRFGKIKFSNASIIEFARVTNNNYDVCIVNMVLHNIINLKENLAAIYKLLKPNGVVIASIPNPNVWEEKKKLNLKLVRDFGSQIVYKATFKIRGGGEHPSTITYVHRSIEKYNEMIKEAGFKILESTFPIIIGNGQDKDLLFCVWQKN